MKAPWTVLLPILSVATAALLGVGCGELRDSDRAMTAGEQLSRDNGCTACHGPNGEGGSGPKLSGLYQSQVRLVDGTTVVADDAYLTESIEDPTAKQVKGYGVMPRNSMSDAEVQAVVEFIKALQR